MVASVVRKLIKSKKRKAAEDKINNIALKNAAKRQGIVPKKQQKELLKKAKARFVDSKPKIPQGTPVPKPPTTKSKARQMLKKFGVPGAVITGVLGVAGNKAIRDNKKTKVAAKPAAKPARRRGSSGPTMTSMGRPSTGPKPRNKDRRVKPRRPSGPSMTGFRK